MERRPTVLVVDDDVIFAVSIVFLVEYMGAKGLRAYDGDQALELIRNNEIDAVVSDVNMPGMNGLELLRKIKQYKQELPVIIISGNVDARMADEAFRNGAFGVLAKLGHVALPMNSVGTGSRWKRPVRS